jgi:hypothetical protein
LILEHAEASAELTRLQRLERAWQRNQPTLRATIAAASERAEVRDREIAAVTQALGRRIDTRGERFAITINASTIRERKPAGEMLARWAAAAQPGRTERLAWLGGLEILATVREDYRAGGREIVLSLDGLPGDPARASLAHASENPLTLIRQLEHRVSTLDEHAARLRSQRDHALLEAQRARQALTRPFKHAEQLASARERHAQITERMRTSHQPAPAPAHTDETTPTPPPSTEDVRALRRANAPAPPRPAVAVPREIPARPRPPTSARSPGLRR